MTNISKNFLISLPGLIGIAAVIGLLLYVYNLDQETAALSKHQEELEGRIVKLETDLGVLLGENTSLSDKLAEERERNDKFATEIKDISGTVGVLKKLSETDKELLQKYSKIYFLNEHFVPLKLSDVPTEYLYNSSKPQQIHGDIKNRLTAMLKEAKEDDVDLKVVSAYRSYGTQSDLKASYRVTYGAGTANQFSADQGYSEHQLGTAIDFTTAEISTVFDGFQNTKAYAWLKDNSYKYGFTLSYPPNNSYYQYEPWHWRFVGRDLARDLARENKYFYDLDQREIDKYLVNIFD